MTYVRAIQAVDPVRDADEAADILAAMAGQHGYLGGRILPASPTTPRWRVQTFWADDDDGDPTGGWLPDGMRRVIVPRRMIGDDHVSR